MYLSGEVWYANFPKEEDKTQLMERPCVIVCDAGDDVVAIKLTKTNPREEDEFDVSIVKWQEAGLKIKSTARVSKYEFINKGQILNRKGKLDPDDENRVAISLQRYIDSQE
ncbi:TPA: type II toxin-antitoxin system PemK/MazF family toxin [Bacillus cereus]|nr:type II toxin-antitoxin system PemK/MazF family toxin [Bacillus cereus]